MLVVSSQLDHLATKSLADFPAGLLGGAIGVAVAAVGVALGIALPLIVSWLIAAHPPVNQPPPNCPPGSYLYARSLMEGKFESPMYHCFRDADEREDTWIEPRPT